MERVPKRLQRLRKLTARDCGAIRAVVIMKIKALRAVRNHKEADTLKASLGIVDNEYGDQSIMTASSAFRNGKYTEALKSLTFAEKAPRSNKVTLKFLRCAIEIELGNNANLSETCELARAAGREADALQLQARAALIGRDWREAESKLNEIKRKDFFDLAVELRMLDLKLSDLLIQGDPVELPKATERREEVLRLIASSVEGGRF